MQKQKDVESLRHLFASFLLRRVLDSNQWIPYDIGSLANCWFKPLTQLSVVLNPLKSCAKVTLFRNNAKFYQKKLLFSAKCKIATCEKAIYCAYCRSKNLGWCRP